MNPLVRYYLHQAGRGAEYGSVGPIYALPPFVQRGHGLGDILGGLWRVVRPLLWSGAKTLGKETMRTGGRILADIADKAPGTSTQDIISRHVNESTQNLVKKLRGGGRKRKRRATASRPTAKKRKVATTKKKNNKTSKRRTIKRRRPPANITKRDIFS